MFLLHCSLTGSVSIMNNAFLSSLPPLPASMLTSSAQVVVQANPALASLQFLAGIRAVDQVNVVNNSALADLRGLESLQSVWGLEIGQNARLTGTAALRSLQQLSWLKVYENPMLTAVTLPNTQLVTVSRRLVFANLTLRVVRSRRDGTSC